MNGEVIPLRPRRTGFSPRQPTFTPRPAEQDAEAASLARALHVAQRALDDGLAVAEVGSWTGRRDLQAGKLLRHLGPGIDEDQLTELTARLVTWLEAGTKRRPEQVLTYARTLCLPHIDRS